VRRTPETLRERYDLTDKEWRRLVGVARSKGMQANCMLYRANRLIPAVLNMPDLCAALGDDLAGLLSEYWESEPVTDVHFIVEADRFCRFLQARDDLSDEVSAILERERKRLRLHELQPKIMSSFVRNKLISEVYLPLVGSNLAKQIGVAGEKKRTDLMGLLLLVSPPGYGKTTLLEYIATRLGLVYVPAERELFPTMTVLENLELGAYTRIATARKNLEYVLALFPRLAERARQLAGTLSGGEQQMLAIGRALMSGPKVLMLDEPSTGLAPKAVAELYRNLSRLKRAGLTIVVTEQQVPLALSLTDRAYVLEQGTIRLSGRSAELLGDPGIKRAYLGVA
jgi:ABC-type lipopolysaccharide export system ATPase subunit